MQGPNFSLALVPKVGTGERSRNDWEKPRYPRNPSGVYSLLHHSPLPPTLLSLLPPIPTCLMSFDALTPPAAPSASLLKAKGGFEIYVDPTDDPDIREIFGGLGKADEKENEYE